MDDPQAVSETQSPLANASQQPHLESGESGSPQMDVGSKSTKYDMESSMATLKHEQRQAETSPTSSPQKQHMPFKQTQALSMEDSIIPAVSRTHTTIASSMRNAADRSPNRFDMAFDERPSVSEDEGEPESQSEIQSIMEQFTGEVDTSGKEKIMSPRLELAGPLLGSPVQHPPRKSSLEPLNKSISNTIQSIGELRLSATTSSRSNDVDDDEPPPVPPKAASGNVLIPVPRVDGHANTDAPMSPTASSLHRPPPPEPEAEPDLPFDFHRFLEQLRHKTADPVAKFLRSFLSEFGKKQWMVHEQVKIIGDFLAFIANKMSQCEVWREVSDAEFDNAREGMEKLVMNRLYTQTFSPAIAQPQQIPGQRSRRRNPDRSLVPGRRGQHQEDVERDDILAQKVSIYGWIKEEHLDIKSVGESGRRFLVLAQQELSKIKTYRAPRDKIICVLNCCKVIFGLLKHAKSDTSADSFMPLLIYVILHANPDHLISNVQYILRFRNQDKLGGEAGYYLSSLMGAVQFIENLDRTSLTISDAEFEVNVEHAVSAIAEKHRAEGAANPSPAQFSEKSTLSQPEASRLSVDREPSMPRRSTSSYGTDHSDDVDDQDAIGGLLRTIQRPLSSIGRIFSDEGPVSHSTRSTSVGPPPRLHPATRSSSERRRSPQRSHNPNQESTIRSQGSAAEAAARQASAESAEAQRIQRVEHTNVVDTLAGMFPDLDREIISDVVAQKNGRVGLAVDACLSLSS